MSAHVWHLPGERPGTLEEIFAAEDSRRQNLALVEIRKVDGFRKCSEVAGAPVDPYDLILAVMVCISFHLHPLDRRSHHRRELRLLSQAAEKAAKALEELATAISQSGRQAWEWRLCEAGFSDPTDPRLISHLRDLSAGLDYSLAQGFKDRGGRSRMMAFEQLVRNLARIFERTTGQPATLTRDHFRVVGYSGRFWDFVEIIRPITAAIIETSGTGPLEQPASEIAHGRFIEKVLEKVRTEKTCSNSR